MLPCREERSGDAREGSLDEAPRPRQGVERIADDGGRLLVEQGATPIALANERENDEALRKSDVKLAEAEKLLNEKQALVEAAAKEARFYSCRASVERVMAEESLQRSQGMQRLASEAQCAARVSQEKGDRTL